jgi:hypothetical protein
MGKLRKPFVILAGFAAWMAIWVGCWLAGEMLFPGYESPAAVLGSIGLVLGIGAAGAIFVYADPRSESHN